MLVVYDFEGGSNAPKIRLSRWLTSSYNPTNASCEVNSNSPAFGCWGATLELTAPAMQFAEGKVNTVTVVDELKPGGSNPGVVEFGEAGINLTDAGVFPVNTCEAFGSAYAVSRSSGSSAQAAMQDIVGPGDFTVSNCASLMITKESSDGGSQEGAQFTLYSGNSVQGTVIGTCTVDEDGLCTSSDFDNLQPGVYTIDETNVPDGYDPDPDLPFTFTLGAGAQMLEFTDLAAPGTVSITKVDDDGDPVPGATFTLYSPQGFDDDGPTGDPTGFSCTTDADGVCEISGVDPGDYTIDESVVPSGYAKDDSFPKNITIDNGETEEVSATDPRTFKAIVLVCRQSDDTLHSSDVKINGSTRPDSLTSAQAAAAGLDEGALCGLTQGARGGLVRSDNDQIGLITIP